jgi:hypothetical protein
MSDENFVSGDEPARTETFDADGPLDLDISLTLGRVDVRLVDPTAGTGAVVEVRHDTASQAPWAEGMATVLNWVTERFGEFGTELRGSPAQAVRECRVEKTGNRLVVAASKALPLRNIPLAVTVTAPAGSQLKIRAGSADVKTTGAAGRADVATGSGDVALERADGAVTVRTGSGAITLGPTLAGLQVRSGSGDVEASSVAGSATLATGTGAIWLGVVAGEVLARSGSGDMSVAEAASGSLELITGSGEVRVGIRSGIAAEVELSSGAGKVSSELDLATTPPEGDVPLRIRARTGSGDAVVTTAAQ